MKDTIYDMNQHLQSFKLKLEEMQSNQSVLKFNLNEIRMVQRQIIERQDTNDKVIKDLTSDFEKKNKSTIDMTLARFDEIRK